MKCLIYQLSFLVFSDLTSAIFDTAFLKNEDSCSNPKLSDTIAENIIQIGKNFIIPDPKRDTRFFLYTRKNMNRSIDLFTYDKNSVEASNFNPKHPTRILIHGFQNTHRNCLSVLLRKAYLSQGDFNIIIVDWSIMAARICYLKAISWLDEVAEVIHEFTKFLHNEFNVSYDNIYLIGHSLGAHVAGLTGRLLKTGEKYNTIYGLDPAGPIYQNFKNEDVLRSDDANYVETIHTDMKAFGYKGQIGDASIYPNYGSSQKRCSFFNFFKLDFSCNHASAYIYFAKTITNPELFLAKRCNNFNDILKSNCQCDPKQYNDCDNEFQMGGEPSQKKTGVFYLNVKKNI